MGRGNHVSPSLQSSGDFYPRQEGSFGAGNLVTGSGRGAVVSSNEVSDEPHQLFILQFLALKAQQHIINRFQRYPRVHLHSTMVKSAVRPASSCISPESKIMPLTRLTKKTVNFILTPTIKTNHFFCQVRALSFLACIIKPIL